MVRIAYHASHEQFPPSQLLDWAVLAEKAGFDAVHSSDHFYPWSVRQGQSGFVFSWMGAAMQATRLPFSMICIPGQRYHPAIAAQAIATLAEMFPGRLMVELGSGEALNEKITGEEWPAKDIRNERLQECAGIIRRLMNGEEVNHEGHVKVKEAKLYTRPAVKPLLFCAAITLKTAEWAGNWADGLVTVAELGEDSAGKAGAFRASAGKQKPVYIKYSFSYHTDRATAIEGAYDQWRANILSPDELADFTRPEQFDAAAEKITRQDIIDKVPIHENIPSLMEAIGKMDYADCIILHNVNKHQELFIQDYSRWKLSEN